MISETPKVSNQDESIDKQYYLDEMVKNLPVLRACVRISQRELANQIGITRQSMMAIETGKRSLQWSTYLALVLVFQQNKESRKLLESFSLFDSSILQQD
jgi:Predicted transcriptional regulators